jgi:hypothetical protein
MGEGSIALARLWVSTLILAAAASRKELVTSFTPALAMPNHVLWTRLSRCHRRTSIGGEAYKSFVAASMSEIAIYRQLHRANGGAMCVVYLAGNRQKLRARVWLLCWEAVM